MTPSPEALISQISEYSSVAASYAGIGACELAGMLVSVLSTHPELINPFMEDPSKTVMDNIATFQWENGSLSWLAQNGDIVSPAELRAHLGKWDC